MIKNPALKQSIYDVLFLTLGIGLFYLIWLGSHPLFTPDEGRYSEVAREMLITHDFITPRLNGVVFLDKPILYYWLQASAIHLFGLNEWALRLWPMLLGVLGCVMTYIAGLILFERRTALLAAFILATSPLYFGGSHYANLDLEVASLVSISLLTFIVAMNVKSSRVRTGYLILSYVFSAFAVLTKGLLGIAFPCLIISLWVIASGRWDALKKMRLVSGLLLFLSIVLPWYWLVQKANPEFFEFFFIKQQVSRFLTTEHFNNRTPIWFYLPIVFAGLFPWSVFAIQSLVDHFRKIKKQRKLHSNELYFIIWFLFVLVFFSVPQSKTIGYILPTFPPLALLIAKYLNEGWDKAKHSHSIGIFFFILTGVVCSIAAIILPYISSDISIELKPYLLFIGTALFLTCGTVFLIKLKKRPIYYSIYAIGIMTIIFLLTLSFSAKVVNEKTIKPLAVELKNQLKPEDEIITFFRYYQDLPIYIGRKITIVADWKAKNIPLHDNWVRELWYGMPFQNTNDWLINEDAFWSKWYGSKRLFVFTDPHHLNTILKKSKTPVNRIGQFKNIMLIANKPLAT